MQKESVDDSDRIDDAVDPRVQVRAAVEDVCVASSTTVSGRGGGSRDIDISSSCN